MKTLVVPLGYYSNKKDEISQIAGDRYNESIMLHINTPDSDILLTGHSEYQNYEVGYSWVIARDYFLQQGVNSKKIIGGVTVNNTAEELFLAKKVANDLGYEQIIVVTSEYHMPRVLLLIDHIMIEENIITHTVADKFTSKKEEENSLAHEQEAIEKLQKGFYYNERMEGILKDEVRDFFEVNI